MTGTSPAEVGTSADALHEYHSLIQPARERFAVTTGICGMISSDTDARTMAAFLLHFSALSVPITDPVEGWIRRAGERCTAVGLPRIGKALSAHAKAEAGHQQYHIDDFAALVEFWNARWEPRVGHDQIVRIGMTRGGERYRAVHEDNIAGDTPYCQLAIEYEIELLPVEFGPPFVQNCTRLFGPDILRCMSFVTSHVEFDVGHTKFNAHVLGQLLADDPTRLGPLVAAGSAVLGAFADHLTECLGLGASLVGRSDRP